MRKNYYRTIKKKDEYKTTKILSFKKKKKIENFTAELWGFESF
jgi:hypothetical protein